MTAKKGSSGSKGGKPVDYRRADNGHYTTPDYAKRHPNTTIKETRKK